MEPLGAGKQDVPTGRAGPPEGGLGGLCGGGGQGRLVSECQEV